MLTFCLLVSLQQSQPASERYWISFQHIETLLKVCKSELRSDQFTQIQELKNEIEKASSEPGYLLERHQKYDTRLKEIINDERQYLFFAARINAVQLILNLPGQTLTKYLQLDSVQRKHFYGVLAELRDQVNAQTKLNFDDKNTNVALASDQSIDRDKIRLRFQSELDQKLSASQKEKLDSIMRNLSMRDVVNQFIDSIQSSQVSAERMKLIEKKAGPRMITAYHHNMELFECPEILKELFQEDIESIEEITELVSAYREQHDEYQKLYEISFPTDGNKHRQFFQDCVYKTNTIFEAKIFKKMTTGQKARLKEIDAQVIGPNVILADHQEAFGVTKEQLIQASQARMSKIRSWKHVSTREDYYRLYEATSMESFNVLTDAQKEKWKKMIGKPIPKEVATKAIMLFFERHGVFETNNIPAKPAVKQDK